MPKLSQKPGFLDLPRSQALPGNADPEAPPRPNPPTNPRLASLLQPHESTKYSCYFVVRLSNIQNQIMSQDRPFISKGDDRTYIQKSKQGIGNVRN